MAQILPCAALIIFATTVLIGQEVKATPASKASLALRAVLSSSIRLSSETVWLAAALKGEESRELAASCSVTMEWNVDSLTRKIQLIALFPASGAALQDTEGHNIDAGELEISVNEESWQAFPQRGTPTQSSGVIVLSQNIGQFSRQGRGVYHLTVRMRHNRRLLASAQYSGVLQFLTKVQ